MTDTIQSSEQARHSAEPSAGEGGRAWPGTIHVVYRSCGGENRKRRPPFFSKLLALLSLLFAMAVDGGSADITYLNDGPIPSERTRVMRDTGRTLSFERLGSTGSMRAALAFATTQAWDADDVVWFAEDDHLYRPDAITGLRGAASAFPEADYFGLYASIGSKAPDGQAQPDYAHVPPGWSGTEPVLIDGHAWCRGLSTTSTFGARVRAVTADHRLMETVMRSGGAWDHTTCLALQGFLPFPWRDLRGHFGPEVSWRRKALSMAIRGSVNLLQIARSATGAPKRLLVAADPPLETHLETDHLAVGTDWAQVAADCRAWGTQQGWLPPDPERSEDEPRYIEA